MALKEIAEKAEVSISTVSLVLAGKGRVSDSVRDKVLSIAKALKYKSPLYAENAGNGNLIGILYHTDEKWSHVYNFIRPAVQAVEKSVRKAGLYQILIPFSSEEKTSSLFEKIQAAGVKSLCTIHYANEELFSNLELRGVPVVIINNSQYQDKFSTVCVDDFQGAYEGTRHLLELGHKDILFAEYERQTMSSVIDDRYFGFQKALTESYKGTSQKRRLTIHRLKSDELRRKLENVFKQASPPTAIFAHDDYLALHIITALEDIGIMVPEDVSIIAPGDVLDYTEPFIPKITTMKIDSVLMGSLAGEMLLKRLEDNSKKLQTLKVKQQLVVRESCHKLINQ